MHVYVTLATGWLAEPCCSGILNSGGGPLLCLIACATCLLQPLSQRQQSLGPVSCLVGHDVRLPEVPPHSAAHVKQHTYRGPYPSQLQVRHALSAHARTEQSWTETNNTYQVLSPCEPLVYNLLPAGANLDLSAVQRRCELPADKFRIYLDYKDSADQQDTQVRAIS